MRYRVFVQGTDADVTISGQGRAFRSIRVDGRPVATAVLTGPAHRIEAVRGIPAVPYLAHATATVTSVVYARRALRIRLRGEAGQVVRLVVAGPPGLRRAFAGRTRLARSEEGQVATFRYTTTLASGVSEVVLRFE